MAGDTDAQMPRWRTVAASEQYVRGSPEAKRALESRYFDEVIAPRVDEDERDLAREHFMARVGSDPRVSSSAASAASGGLPRESRGFLGQLADTAGALFDDAQRATPVARYISAARRALIGPTEYEQRLEREEKQLNELRDMYELAVKYKLQGT